MYIHVHIYMCVYIHIGKLLPVYVYKVNYLSEYLE